MAAGTPFAAAHTFSQTGPFRPPQPRRGENVVFAGSGTAAGGRGADGAGQRAAGRRARDGQGPGLPLASLAMTAPPRRWTPPTSSAAHPRRARPHLLPGHPAAAARPAPARVRAVRLRPLRRRVRRHLERPDPDALLTWSRTAMTVAGSTAWPGRPAVTRCSRPPAHGAPPRPSAGAVRGVPHLDADGHHVDRYPRARTCAATCAAARR